MTRHDRLSCLCHRSRRAIEREFHRYGNTPKCYRLRKRHERLWSAYQSA